MFLVIELQALLKQRIGVLTKQIGGVRTLRCAVFFSIFVTVAGLLLLVAGVPAIAQLSDDSRMHLLKECRSGDTMASTSDKIAINTRLGKTTLSDNIIDVQEAYLWVAGCYAQRADIYIDSLPAPCTATKAMTNSEVVACYAKIDKFFATTAKSRAYRCANAATYQAASIEAEQAIAWAKRAKAIHPDFITNDTVERYEGLLSGLKSQHC